VWRRGRDSNPRNYIRKPCNCKACGTSLIFCMHFCMHSVLLIHSTSLKWLHQSQESLRQKGANNALYWQKTYGQGDFYDAQVFPVLAQIRTAAVTKVMPAEVLNPNTLYESQPGIWKTDGLWKHPVWSGSRSSWFREGTPGRFVNPMKLVSWFSSLPKILLCRNLLLHMKVY